MIAIYVANHKIILKNTYHEQKALLGSIKGGLLTKGQGQREFLSITMHIV